MKLKRLKYKTREEAVKDHVENYRVRGFDKGKFDRDGPDRNRLLNIFDGVAERSIVLDIGCNDGSLGKVLELEKKCTVFAVDPVTELVFLAQSKGILAQEGIAERLPFGSGKFEVVIMAEVLEHLYDPEEGLREVHRVISRDGVFLGSVPHPDGGLGRNEIADYHQTVFELDELTKLLSQYFKYTELKETKNFETDKVHWINWISREKI